MNIEKKKIHLIGNAHLDPVWLWRFGDGLSEIKATFRSALDRIREFDEFIFTSACAFYYLWVEENCPEMFEEIKQAIKNGKWKLVGGMWIQPDCNMPSSESFARHFLYSQRYFYEKFGVTVKTGYNVDSFGHSAGLPTLLRQAGIENYVYMRPDDGAEMKYPFPDRVFRWRNGEDEVLAYHLKQLYCTREMSEAEIKLHDVAATQSPTDIMMFYGVGNHGGGPTVSQIKLLMAKRSECDNELIFSDPDSFFDEFRLSKKESETPIYVGELQNHASGCYAANSEIKRLNRKSESVLSEAETLSSLAEATAGYKTDVKALTESWQAVLFNQFHDVLCGCSIKEACSDACAFLGGAIGVGMKQTHSAAQRMSWAVDTSKGVSSVSKDGGYLLWEKDSLGTPIVVFNPLSHKVKVPVYVVAFECASVTDSDDNPIAFQFIQSEYSKIGATDMRGLRFMAEIEPLGWATYWVYEKKEFYKVTNPNMIAERHRLSNGCAEVIFDESTGDIKSYKLKDGRELAGKYLSRAIVIDDSENDTWSHAHFVFDEKIGEFSNPEFAVIDSGDCQVSLLVRTEYKNSSLEQIYTLYEGDERIHVKAKLTLNERLVSVKLCFDSGIENAKWLREIPGGVVTAKTNGREMPMLRYMVMHDGAQGVAVINNGRYSSSAENGEMRMVAARSCYYADHSAPRHILHPLQDIGENEFEYIIMPYGGSLTPIVRAAEELHTEFISVPETYHKGALKQKSGAWSCSADNVSVMVWKTAEDGNGKILRVCETAGKTTSCEAELMGVRVPIKLAANGFATYRIVGNNVTPCDFTEMGR